MTIFGNEKREKKTEMNLFLLLPLSLHLRKRRSSFLLFLCCAIKTTLSEEICFMLSQTRPRHSKNRAPLNAFERLWTHLSVPLCTTVYRSAPRALERTSAHHSALSARERTIAHLSARERTWVHESAPECTKAHLSARERTWVHQSAPECTRAYLSAPEHTWALQGALLVLGPETS